MNNHTLHAHMKARGWRQADLARRVGVSRQAVSQWLTGERAGMRADHLLRTARALGVSAEQLGRPLPGLNDEEAMATLLWDRLYPQLDDFAIAVLEWRPDAVARLVQIYGLYVAERILGRRVWDAFESYRRHIHPVRRRPLEGLVEWRRSERTLS